MAVRGPVCRHDQLRERLLESHDELRETVAVTARELHEMGTERFRDER